MKLIIIIALSVFAAMSQPNGVSWGQSSLTNPVTPGNIHDVVNQSGGLKVSAFGTPTAPTVTPTCTGRAEDIERLCVTTYTYKVVALAIDSTFHTDASSAGSTTTGAATLSATQYNTLTWPAVSNAYAYDVYRTAGGATQGKIASAIRVLTLRDTGLAGDSSTAPTTNTTGAFIGAASSVTPAAVTAARVCTITSSSATAYVGATSPAMSTYPTGVEVRFTANQTSGAAPTLDCGGGALAIRDALATAAVPSGFLESGYTYTLRSNGTYWLLQEPAPGASGEKFLSNVSVGSTLPSGSPAAPANSVAQKYLFIGSDFTGWYKDSDLGGSPEHTYDSSMYAIQTSGSGIAYWDKVVDATTDGSGLVLRKARGTAAAPANVQDGDQIGYIDYRSFSGTKYWQQVSIAANVDGTFTSGQAPPSRLIFATNAANGGSTERMRIDSGGHVTINTAGAQYGGTGKTFLTVKSNAADADYTVWFQAGTTTGSSNGLRINAGSNSSDYNLALFAANGTTALMTLRGDGHLSFGGDTVRSSVFNLGGTTGELSKFGTLTNGWGANHAFGIANGNAMLVSKIDTNNDTNRVLMIYRDDTTHGGVVSLYQKNGTTAGIILYGDTASAASGTRFLCIDTAGVVSSSASACSGT